MIAPDEKICPMCGETIKAVALKCRHCGEALDPGSNPSGQQQIEEAAKLLLRERHDKLTALQIFLTGLIGCFAPIVAIYGTFFLLMRPYPFPRKGLAIAGTVLHWIWTVLLILAVMSGQFPDQAVH
jgi:hypothetical protein